MILYQGRYKGCGRINVGLSIFMIFFPICSRFNFFFFLNDWSCQALQNGLIFINVPGRRRTAGNDRIRRIYSDLRKQDSEIGSGLRFRLISGKFGYSDLTNVSVSRFLSGSDLRFPCLLTMTRSKLGSLQIRYGY